MITNRSPCINFTVLNSWWVQDLLGSHWGQQGSFTVLEQSHLGSSQLTTPLWQVQLSQWFFLDRTVSPCATSFPSNIHPYWQSKDSLEHSHWKPPSTLTHSAVGWQVWVLSLHSSISVKKYCFSAVIEYWVIYNVPTQDVPRLVSKIGPWYPGLHWQ